MSERINYNINLDVKYGMSTLNDVPGIIDATSERWFNQSLTEVNDCVVRIGIIQGEFHWHKHDEEDEFFFVVEGELLLDIEGGETQVLKQHQGYTVPRGVVHRTRAPEKVVMLMVEKSGVIPTGDE